MLSDRLHCNDCSITGSCWHAVSIARGRERCVAVEWLLSSDWVGMGRELFCEIEKWNKLCYVARDNRVCSIRISQSVVTGVQ